MAFVLALLLLRLLVLLPRKLLPPLPPCSDAPPEAPCCCCSCGWSCRSLLWLLEREKGKGRAREDARPASIDCCCWLRFAAGSDSSEGRKRRENLPEILPRSWPPEDIGSCVAMQKASRQAGKQASKQATARGQTERRRGGGCWGYRHREKVGDTSYIKIVLQ